VNKAIFGLAIVPVIAIIIIVSTGEPIVEEAVLEDNMIEEEIVEETIVEESSIEPIQQQDQSETTKQTDSEQTLSCSGTKRCISGVVTGIIDGDTIYAEGDTIYVDRQAIRFALVDAPERSEDGYNEAREFLELFCPVGSSIIIDQDDGQPVDSYGRILGVVYCNGINLNEAVLEAGHAEIFTKFCSVSEFSDTAWAQKFGCGSSILVTDGNPPTNLGLPYAISDLDLEHGASHPMGVFRFAKDKQPHPGIDLQLYDGTKILAMSDGTIVGIKQEGSPVDMGILLQIKESFWGVNYEHFIPDDSLYLGKEISKGDEIGTFVGGYTQIPASIHIDFRFYQDGFTGYSGAFVCWIDYLEIDDQVKLQSAWDDAITDEFIQGWSTLTMEGNLIFKGLLDSMIYPDGPQMCYPIGTDVREPE